MAYNHEYPYVDPNRFNSDWLLHKVTEIAEDMDEFKAINTVTNDGAWDITKQYQAWTVVSDNNVGYISLKPVPAGIAISNTDYWGLIADYDILITDLSTRIGALEYDMDDPAGKVEVLIDRVDNLDTQVGVLNDEILNPYLLVLGDSWSADSSGWPAYVAGKCGYVLQNYARSGYTYSVIGGSQGLFSSALSDAITDITEPQRVKEILIYGGLNDVRLGADNGDIYSACASLIVTAKTNFPNARITVVGVNMSNEQTYIDMEAEAALFIETAARVNGAGFVNSNHWLKFVANTYQGDNTHPSAQGLQIIRSYMLAILGGGTVEPHSLIRASAANGATIVSQKGVFNGALTINLSVILPAAWSDDAWTTVATLLGVNVLPSVSCIAEVRTGGGSLATDVIGIGAIIADEIMVKTFAGSSGANKTIYLTLQVAY